MTNDRELLQLAAKAAGYWDKDFNCYKGPVSFDPLTDDGHALQLAVRLGIDIMFTAEDVEAVATQYSRKEDGEMISPWAWEGWTLKPQDPYAATRRAIVRAAAEIGRQMD